MHLRIIAPLPRQKSPDVLRDEAKHSVMLAQQTNIPRITGDLYCDAYNKLASIQLQTLDDRQKMAGYLIEAEMAFAHEDKYNPSLDDPKSAIKLVERAVIIQRSIVLTTRDKRANTRLSEYQQRLNLLCAEWVNGEDNELSNETRMNSSAIAPYSSTFSLNTFQPAPATSNSKMNQPSGPSL